MSDQWRLSVCPRPIADKDSHYKQLQISDAGGCKITRFTFKFDTGIINVIFKNVKCLYASFQHTQTLREPDVLIVNTEQKRTADRHSKLSVSLQ